MWTWLLAAYIGSLVATIGVNLLAYQVTGQAPTKWWALLLQVPFWFIWYPFYGWAAVRARKRLLTTVATEVAAYMKDDKGPCTKHHCPHCDAHVDENGDSLAAAGMLSVCGRCHDTWIAYPDLDAQVVSRGGTVRRVSLTEEVKP